MKDIFKEVIKAIGNILGNQYLVLGIAIVAVLTMGGLQLRGCQENERLATYSRQLKGDLDQKEIELQQLNTELGLSKSKLVDQKTLADILKREKEEIDEKFEAFKKDHNLQIQSRDRTIAGLRQKLQGGTTVVVIEDPDKDECKGIEHCVISYSWEDTLKRFRLKDPNIFQKGDEVFESEQIFKIYGEVWEQEDGSLQTRRLVLREVYKDEKGEYQPVPDAKADIIDSDFQYHNPPKINPEWQWTDLFRLRMIASPSISIFPDTGRMKLALGLEFFNWEGFGINTHTAFDFQDAEKIEQRLGIAYNPTIFGTELNLAIGASVGTPFAHMFQEYSFNLDLIFYINN